MLLWCPECSCVYCLCVCVFVGRTCVCWGTGKRWPSLPSGTSTGGSHMTCWPGSTTSNAAWTNCLTPLKERGSRWKHTHRHTFINKHTLAYIHIPYAFFSPMWKSNHEDWYQTQPTCLCLHHHPAFHLTLPVSHFLCFLIPWYVEKPFLCFSPLLFLFTCFWTKR